MAEILDFPDRLTSDLESCQYVTVTAGPEIIQQKILNLVGPFFMIASSTYFTFSDRVRVLQWNPIRTFPGLLIIPFSVRGNEFGSE